VFCAIGKLDVGMKNLPLNRKNFGKHILRAHRIVTKDYYDKYLKEENEGVCVNCNKLTSFIDMIRGYREFCSKNCLWNKIWNEKDRLEFSQKCSNRMKNKWRNKEYKNKMLNKIVGSSQGKHIHKTGFFNSTKNNSRLFYRSSYELRAFNILEDREDVIAYELCKFKIDYVKPTDDKIHTYIPDITIFLNDEQTRVIEIKPLAFLNDEILKAKINAAREKFGKNYLIWTEKELDLDVPV